MESTLGTGDGTEFRSAAVQGALALPEPKSAQDAASYDSGATPIPLPPNVSLISPTTLPSYVVAHEGTVPGPPLSDTAPGGVSGGFSRRRTLSPGNKQMQRAQTAQVQAQGNAAGARPRARSLTGVPKVRSALRSSRTPLTPSLSVRFHPNDCNDAGAALRDSQMALTFVPDVESVAFESDVSSLEKEASQQAHPFRCELEVHMDTGSCPTARIRSESDEPPLASQCSEASSGRQEDGLTAISSATSAPLLPGTVMTLDSDDDAVRVSSSIKDLGEAAEPPGIAASPTFSAQLLDAYIDVDSHDCETVYVPSLRQNDLVDDDLMATPFTAFEDHPSFVVSSAHQDAAAAGAQASSGTARTESPEDTGCRAADVSPLVEHPDALEADDTDLLEEIEELARAQSAQQVWTARRRAKSAQGASFTEVGVRSLFLQSPKSVGGRVVDGSQLVELQAGGRVLGKTGPRDGAHLPAANLSFGADGEGPKSEKSVQAAFPSFADELQYTVPVEDYDGSVVRRAASAQEDPQPRPSKDGRAFRSVTLDDQTDELFRERQTTMPIDDNVEIVHRAESALAPSFRRGSAASQSAKSVGLRQCEGHQREGDAAMPQIMSQSHTAAMFKEIRSAPLPQGRRRADTEQGTGPKNRSRLVLRTQSQADDPLGPKPERVVRRANTARGASLGRGDSSVVLKSAKSVGGRVVDDSELVMQSNAFQADDGDALEDIDDLFGPERVVRRANTAHGIPQARGGSSVVLKSAKSVGGSVVDDSQLVQCLPEPKGIGSIGRRESARVVRRADTARRVSLDRGGSKRALKSAKSVGGRVTDSSQLAMRTTSFSAGDSSALMKTPSVGAPLEDMQRVSGGAGLELDLQGIDCVFSCTDGSTADLQVPPAPVSSPAFPEGGEQRGAGSLGRMQSRERAVRRAKTARGAELSKGGSSLMFKNAKSVGGCVGDESQLVAPSHAEVLEGIDSLGRRETARVVRRVNTARGASLGRGDSSVVLKSAKSVGGRVVDDSELVMPSDGTRNDIIHVGRSRSAQAIRRASSARTFTSAVGQTPQSHAADGTDVQEEMENVGRVTSARVVRRANTARGALVGGGSMQRLRSAKSAPMADGSGSEDSGPHDDIDEMHVLSVGPSFGLPGHDIEAGYYLDAIPQVVSRAPSAARLVGNSQLSPAVAFGDEPRDDLGRAQSSRVVRRANTTHGAGLRKDNRLALNRSKSVGARVVDDSQLGAPPHAVEEDIDELGRVPSARQMRRANTARGASLGRGDSSVVLKSAKSVGGRVVDDSELVMQSNAFQADDGDALEDIDDLFGPERVVRRANTAHGIPQARGGSSVVLKSAKSVGGSVVDDSQLVMQCLPEPKGIGSIGRRESARVVRRADTARRVSLDRGGSKRALKSAKSVGGRVTDSAQLVVRSHAAEACNDEKGIDSIGRVPSARVMRRAFTTRRAPLGRSNSSVVLKSAKSVGGRVLDDSELVVPSNAVVTDDEDIDVPLGSERVVRRANTARSASLAESKRVLKTAAKSVGGRVADSSELVVHRHAAEEDGATEVLSEIDHLGHVRSRRALHRAKTAQGLSNQGSNRVVLKSAKSVGGCVQEGSQPPSWAVRRRSNAAHSTANGGSGGQVLVDAGSVVSRPSSVHGKRLSLHDESVEALFGWNRAVDPRAVDDTDEEWLAVQSADDNTAPQCRALPPCSAPPSDIATQPPGGAATARAPRAGPAPVQRAATEGFLKKAGAPLRGEGGVELRPAPRPGKRRGSLPTERRRSGGEGGWWGRGQEGDGKADGPAGDVIPEVESLDYSRSSRPATPATPPSGAISFRVETQQATQGGARAAGNDRPQSPLHETAVYHVRRTDERESAPPSAAPLAASRRISPERRSHSRGAAVSVLAVHMKVRVRPLAEVHAAAQREGWWEDAMTGSCGRPGVVLAVGAQRVQVHTDDGCVGWYPPTALSMPGEEPPQRFSGGVVLSNPRLVPVMRVASSSHRPTFACAPLELPAAAPTAGFEAPAPELQRCSRCGECSPPRAKETGWNDFCVRCGAARPSQRWY